MSPTCPPLPISTKDLPSTFTTLLAVPLGHAYVLWLITSSSFTQSFPPHFPSELCQSVSWVHASLCCFIMIFFNWKVITFFLSGNLSTFPSRHTHFRGFEPTKTWGKIQLLFGCPSPYTHPVKAVEGILGRRRVWGMACGVHVALWKPCSTRVKL